MYITSGNRDFRIDLIRIPTNKHLIMIHRDIPKLVFLLLIAALSIILTSCAVKWEAVNWKLQNPEFKVPADVTEHTFHFDSVSLTANTSILTSRTLAFGPPFMPFIRVATPETPVQFDNFFIFIDSSLDTTEMDFSKVRIEIPGKEISKVHSVDYFFRSTSKRDRYGEQKLEIINVPIGKDIISNEKRHYHLTFDDLPSDAEEILVNLGRIEIGGKEYEIPALRYRTKKTRGYYPVNIH